MSRERYYETLGLKPGAAAQEVKDAYRDLAKVWHPDRFAHDPKLQQKAQEKLKEINEAYKELTSPTPRRRIVRNATSAPRRTPPSPQRPQHQPGIVPRAARKHPGAVRFLLPSLAAAALVLTLFVSYRAISSKRVAPEPRQPEDLSKPAVEQTTEETYESGVRKEKKSPARQGAPEKDSASASTGSSPAAPALPTVNRTIDPATGLLATRACPNKALMTYPSGQEPREHCDANHSPKNASGREPAVSAQTKPAEPSATEPGGQGKSRLKSIVGTVTSPGKWFRKKKEKPSDRVQGSAGQG